MLLPSSFRCAKCHERVTADTNLLLLSDGSPVCGSCSYNCNVCKLPILDEAIMTGDESYHAACFTCRSCSHQIQELVFAKTSNGIYCMACHNERVARSRRHAEQKRNKSKSAAARKEREKEKERERRKDVPVTPSRPGLSPNPSGASPSMSIVASPSVVDTPTFASPNSASPTQGASIQNAHTSFPFPAKRMSTQSIHRVLEESAPPLPPYNGMTASNSVPVPNSNRHATPPPSRPSTSMDQHTVQISNAHSSLRTRVDTFPLPNPESETSLVGDKRQRKSYDDGVRPLSYFLTPSKLTAPPASINGPNVGNAELEVPGGGPQQSTSRKDKRRSINPGLFLDSSSVTSESDGPLSSSPPAASRGSMDKFINSSNGRLSPHPVSPLRSSFCGEGGQGLRLSGESTYFSPAASPIPGDFSRPSGSRSPSPRPASQSYPMHLGAGRGTPPPPSLSVISPSPGQTPDNHHLAGVQKYDPLPRTNSLPNGSLASQAQQRNGRSASRNGCQHMSRDSSRQRADSQSPSMNERTSASPYELSDGGETDGDVVVVPRETRRNSGDMSDDKPPIPPPKSPSPSHDIVIRTENDDDDDDEVSDDDNDLPPEKVAPFLAPALPPMRFSVSGTDFGDLLNSVRDPSIKITSGMDDERHVHEPRSDSSDSPDLSAGDENDVTVVIAPPPQAHENQHQHRAALASSDGPSSPPLSTPTSTQTIRDDQPALAVDIPDSEAGGALHGDDLTPPPSSAKSTSSLSSSNVFTSMSSIAPSRGVALPMSLHQSAVLAATDQRQRVDSSASMRSIQFQLNGNPTTAQTTTTSASLPTISVSAASRPAVVRADSSSMDLVARRLREALRDTSERGSTAVKLDREFAEAIMRALDGGREKAMDLKGQIDTIKRTSQQVMTGFTVAQSEYHKEIAGRRDAEAEVTRLRVQLSGQAARLTAMSAEHRRQEVLEQMSKDMSSNLGVLEKETSKLKVERDLTLAEVEELGAGATSPQSPILAEGAATMTRSLTARFDNIKTQYKKDLEPLKQQREALIREINELKEARDIFLEETTALNARNEELADLNSQIARQIEIAVSDTQMHGDSNHLAASELASPISSSNEGGSSASRPSKAGGIFGAGKSKAYHSNVSGSGPPSNSPSFSSVSTAITTIDEKDELARVTRVQVPRMVETPVSEPASAAPAKKFKWFGGVSKEKKSKLKMHNFQQQNVMRVARCDHCGDKMWGAQLKCSGCGTACHPKCHSGIQTPCQPNQHREEPGIFDIAPLPPSMFGRDLVDQVRSDARGNDRSVPVIVEKCIAAVEALAMDYEGIYRKTGGSGQSKAITQLFERGNYDAFDLRDTEAFNDICSVTSVLKNYFRSLPNPLLTYALHDAFVEAACIRDPREKYNTLISIIPQLPREHYHTLRVLMLHLNRVQRRSDENLMNARNLGVVFGPTLMRSDDVSKEFTDMAGKALSVEWLVENAPQIFPEAQQ